MAIWKSYRIADIISEIYDEKFVIPDIQRPLVWDESKMELLFDTLLKGDSFGGVMVIEEDRGSIPMFSYRTFTRNGQLNEPNHVEKLQRQHYLVLDGQQRLQAFYIGLLGKFNGKILFFDLFSDYTLDFEFKFAADIKHLPLFNKNVPTRIIPDHKWFPASEILSMLKETNDEEDVAFEIIEALGIVNEIHKNHIVKNIRAFYKNVITSETLGISKVIKNTALGESINRQRIIELYRRLNDAGIKISPADLRASILKNRNWEKENDDVLRASLINFEERHNDKLI